MDDIWEIYPTKPELCSLLSGKLNVSPVVAQILINRGLEKPEDAASFLNPDLTALHDPFLLKDMKTAVARIKTAFEKGEKILVYGDYDVDGTCGVSIILLVLKGLGVEAEYYIPDRFEEGYGLNEGAMIKAGEKGVGLILSVDCGISSVKEVECANGLGIDVIINDHHRPGDILPPAAAIINPKQEDCPYPYKELCSAGVALKLMQALCREVKDSESDSDLFEHLDLVALATVADIVPLTQENRILVTHGLKMIQNTDKVGIKALIEVSAITEEKVNSWHIGYLLGPRINAGGRLSSASICVQLLTTDSPSEAKEVAEKLNRENQERKDVEVGILNEAISIVEEENLLENLVLTLASPEWHPGVIGIVASRLVERYHRPVALIALEGGEGRGSMRGVRKFNVFDALNACGNLLGKYGGHLMAGGFSLAEKNITEVGSRMNLLAHETLALDDLVPVTQIDMEIPLDMVDLDLIREVDKLGPFGHGNKEPVFSSMDADIVPNSARIVGKDHLKLRLANSKGGLDAIGFRMGDLFDKVAVTNDDAGSVDLAYRIQENKWRGLITAQINLKSIGVEKDLLGHEEETKDEDSDISFVKSLYRSDAAETASSTTSHAKPIVVSSDDKTASAEHRRQLSRLDASELIESIRNHLLRDLPYSPPELQAIEHLLTGDNTLTTFTLSRSHRVVLATVAAVKAIRDNQATLVVCPLRSLVDDWNTILEEELSSLGIRVVMTKDLLTPVSWDEVSSGNEVSSREEASPSEEASSLEDASSEEEVERPTTASQADVILATPEFVGSYMDRLAEAKDRLGFLVIDGAHRINGSNPKHQQTYKDISGMTATLGSLLTLAAMAPADDESVRQIVETLKIRRLVVDDHERSNLILIDRRGILSKDSYLSELIGSGEKTIIYLKGQEEVARVARLLGRRQHSMFKEGRIGFYHAGMSSATKSNLEKLFRDGPLTTVVSADDFGEGIEDVRHLVHYHLSFSWEEFSRKSSHAGLDGLPAYIHLICGEKDVQLNRKLLNHKAPDDETLRSIYKALSRSKDEDKMVALSDREVARSAKVSADSVAAAVAILAEIGIIEAKEGPDPRRIRIKKVEDKRDLRESIRYCEGANEREEFEKFSSAIFKTSASQLSDIISGSSRLLQQEY